MLTQKIGKEYKKNIKNSSSFQELESLRVKLLGRRGLLKQAFTDLKKSNPTQKKIQGQKLNKLKNNFEKLIIQKTKELKALKPLASTLPSSPTPRNISQSHKFGHLHPITVTELEINSIFRSLGFSVYDGPEIETDEYCFQRLNVPPDHPSRDLQDSIYIRQPTFLLRTQTSSIEARLLKKEKPPFKAAFPGRTYRNEKVNKSNHFIFHQYQGVAVDKNISLKDLIGTLDTLFKHLYGPKAKVRYRPKYYPEVEPGLGLDLVCFSCQGQGCPLCKGAGWLEMGGAGLIHPHVLKIAGINPKKWHGFAFGLGLDRWVMAKYQLSDIRTLLGGNLAYKPQEKTL